MADMRKRSNVYVGAPEVVASGGIQVGKVATSKADFPTESSVEFPTKLSPVTLGFISEDGIERTIDRSTEKIKDWNGDTVVITQSDHSVQLSLTMLEAGNPEVLKMIAGESNVSTSGRIIKVIHNADELPKRSLGFTLKGGQGRKIFIFAPEAQVTSIDPVSYANTSVIGYRVTIECFGVDNAKLVELIERPEDAEGVEEE